MRIKLRQNQSTLPIEKITETTNALEVIASSLEHLPSLNHVVSLKSLYLNTPNLMTINELPTSIESLKLRSFSIKEADLIKIARLENLKILELIDMGINTLTEDFFKKLVRLETLSLKGNRLKDMPSLSSCHKLTRINLDNNQLSFLPESIINTKSINHLSLDHNLFSDEEKDKIFKLFGIWF